MPRGKARPLSTSASVMPEDLHRLKERIVAAENSRRKKEREAQALGVTPANPYGFSAAIRFGLSSHTVVPLHVETSNVLARPFFFDMNVIR